MSRWFLAGFACLIQLVPAVAGNPPPTQLFYVPFPEDQQLAAFDAINTVANDPITVFVTFSAATDGTVIYYDHWEDGYEREITNPTQSTTLIFGDGNPANGYPPGNAADLIPAGTVFSLRNFVTTTTLQAVLDFDARDKIASYKPISLTKTSFPDGTDTLLAGCVEVFERGLWGPEYRSPVGVDMPTVPTPGALANDEDQFNYVAFSISAGAGGATVQIDKDNNGSFEETVPLSEGQSILRDSVNTGGRILADRPVQVVLFTGTLNSGYASRDTTLLPVNRWSSDYFSPVNTPAGDGTVTFLYNPGASAITVNYDYRNSASTYSTASISVPAGGNARVVHSPAVSGTHFGAYRFYTTGANAPLFYAISAVDSDGTAAADNNRAWDGGFTLVGRPSLTTQVLLSLGIGRDPYASANPAENGNPMWICTVGNGHTPETIYVDYNGDNAGALVDPNGNRYDLALSLRELEQRKLLDPDGDQSGMLVYSLNSSVKLAAAWAQDPTLATASQPGIDVASLVPPLREGASGKRSDLLVDADGDGYISAGDTLQYDIRGVNSARASIPGPFAVTDNLPADVTYIANSARYRFSVNGLWQAWTAMPDSPTGTVFPLDGSGFSVPGNMGMGQQLQVTFNAVIDDYANLSTGTLRNTGSVEISPYGLLLPVEWEDPVHGSIGDRLWVDADGDGTQDLGESGLAGIDVFVDANNNGIRDTGETWDTTDSNGNYLLAGLLAGTYTVRVDTADIAAANVGYGPTFDLDGLTTTNVATLSLASAQDRVDADFGYRIGASVGDRVWLDRDADGVLENGEPGMNGVRVYVDLDNDNTFDSGEPNTISSGDGTYYIGNLSAGTWAVRVDTATLPTGVNQTFDLNGGLDHESSVTLLAAEHKGNLDFGYRGTLSLGDLVWEDIDANGTRITYNVINGRIDINNSGGADNNDDGNLGGFTIIDGYVDLSANASIGGTDDGIFQGITIIDGGLDVVVSGAINGSDDLNAAVANEGPLANVRAYLDWNDNGFFDAAEPSSISGSRGLYAITNLYAGTWAVRIDTSTLPVSYVQTYDLTSPMADHSATVALSASRTDVDFGYRNDASISDLVWNDRDADGVRDPGEPGIEGVMVFIDADSDGIFDQATERFDITDVNGAYLIENLASGTYNVRVEISTLPQGAAPTYDLDNITTLNVTSRTLATSESATNVDFGYRSAATFGDYVWNDVDADGVQDAGESGINGVRVYADINGNGTFEGAFEPSAVTNASGFYSIANLMPGNFTARVDTSTLPSGFVQTYDLLDALDHSATFFVSANQTRSDVDFGYTSPATVGDYVWNDMDADGVQDAGEAGISGAIVTLFNSINDTVVASTTSSVAGVYSFGNIMPGSYYVLFDTPAGFMRSIADRGADSLDSDVSVSTGRSPVFSLIGGQTNNTVDAGFYQPSSAGDLVWNDLNANGVKDGAESGLNGVPVTLIRPGFGSDGIAGNSDDATAVMTTTTASGGAYAFTGLRPGIYQVNFGTLAGYNRTLADQGADATDSDANTTSGQTANIVLAAGATDNSVDAGYYQPASIGNFVWNDTNANGQQDAGEPGLDGATVTLTRPGFGADGIALTADDALPVATTTTSGGGAYLFGDLHPGTYRVNFGAFAGYSRTLINQGSDNTDSDANVSSGLTANIVLAAGAANTITDAGYYQPASIGNFVWNDTNADGRQNVGEPGLDGVTVTLIRPGFGADGIAGNADDALAVATTTSSGGGYSFMNLRPGIYQIAFGSITSFTRTLANQGNDATDSDADPDTGQTATFALAAGVPDNTIDAGFYQPGTVFGHLYIDSNGNGDQDPGEPDLSGVNVTVTDSRGNAQTVSTNSSGDWVATVPPGSTTANVDEADPEYPAGYTRTEGVDPSVLTAVAGTGVDAGIDGHAPFANLAIAKTVSNSTPNVGFNVVFTLVATNHGPVSATGVVVMDPLPSGYEFVSAAPAPDYGSTSGAWTIGSLANGASRTLEITAKVLASGNYLNLATISGDQPDPVPGNDTENELTSPVPPGSITGRVLEDTDNDGDGESPIGGVTLTLLDSAGNPVDGDGIAGGVQLVTATTALDGTYSFASLIPGTYGVLQDQPTGYDSLSDKDGDDPDKIRPVVVTAGNPNIDNDFIERLDTCPDDWAQWKFQHPGETPAGNPDADAYDNFAEFAFAMPYDAGTGNKWLGATAWIIQPSTLGPGTIEGVFVRPKGATANVTYTLQYAAVPGNPTVWQGLVITPGLVSTADNGDCTETVTIHDLEALTGLTHGRGVVRIRADLDDDGGGNGDIDHTSHTETEGWTVTGMEICCRTYNNPYQRESVFTGAVTAVNGQDLAFAANDTLALLLSPGGSFYLEVISGDYEGQRFDLVSAAGNTVTLANDSDPHAAIAPFNTLAGPPPTGLTGDRVAIHRHWTLGEVFPVSGLGVSGSQSSADQVQIYAGGAWTIYWLFDGNDENPAAARWVDSADPGMANRGGVVIPPGQGSFFNNKTAVRSILAYGEIRANDFVRPHAPGNNLVGGGYPLNQSANGARGRAMNLTNGFFGSTSFKTADSIFVWKADTVIGAPGYDTYYLLGGVPSQPALTRWIKVGDASIPSRDAETIFSGNRSVITRTAGAVPAHTIPTPWNP